MKKLRIQKVSLPLHAQIIIIRGKGKIPIITAITYAVWLLRGVHV
jgi:hypothetical protein